MTIEDQMLGNTPDKDNPDLEQQMLTPPPTIAGEFKKGVASGVDALQGAGYGLVGLAGDALGIDAVRDFGLEGHARNMEEAQVSAPAVGRFEDISSIKDAALYAAGALGNLAPSMASSVVSGGVGGVLANSLAKGAATKAGQVLAQEAAKKAIQKGAITGLAANTVGTESGSIYGDIYEKTGEHAPGTAAAFGLAAGALDVLPQAALATKLINPVSEAAQAGFAQAAKRVAVEGVKQAASEGATEAAQTAIERGAVAYVDPSQQVFSPEGLSEIANAGVMGAIGGGVLGTTGKAYTEIMGEPAQQPAVEPPGPLTKAAGIAAGAQAAAGKHFPFATADVAQKQADALTNSTGVPHQAAPHPTIAGKWAALPVTPQEGTDGAAAAAATDVATGVPAAGRGLAGAGSGAPVGGAVGAGAVGGQPAAGTAADVAAAAPAAAGAGSNAGNAGAVGTAPTTFGSAEEAQSLLAAMPDRDNFAIVEADEGFQIVAKNKQHTNAGAHKVTPDAVTPKNDVDLAAHEAASSPLNDRTQPTEAQAQANNYKVGRVKLHGLDIGVENSKGSERRGRDTDGNEWSTLMTAHYGRFTGTDAADSTPEKKQGVDVFIGDYPESTRAFVIDQIDPKTGKFDEHKVILGTNSIDEARQLYRDNYQHGWEGDHAISETSLDQLKGWLYSDGTKRPFNAEAFEQKTSGVANATGRRPGVKTSTEWIARRPDNAGEKVAAWNAAQRAEATANATDVEPNLSTPSTDAADLSKNDAGIDTSDADPDYEALFDQAAAELEAEQQAGNATGGNAPERAPLRFVGTHSEKEVSHQLIAEVDRVLRERPDSYEVITYPDGGKRITLPNGGQMIVKEDGRVSLMGDDSAGWASTMSRASAERTLKNWLKGIAPAAQAPAPTTARDLPAGNDAPVNGLESKAVADVHYPNRKLGFSKAATDAQDEYNDHAWANIAAANMQKGDAFQFRGQQVTVEAITDKTLRLRGADGKTLNFSPNGVSWGQFMRDLGGELTRENLQANNILKPKRPLIDILKRDPAVQVDDKGSVFLRDAAPQQAAVDEDQDGDVWRTEYRARFDKREREALQKWGIDPDATPKTTDGYARTVFRDHETAFEFNNGKGRGSEKHLSVRIEVAQGPNGKWANSVSLQEGTEGSSSLPGVFDDMHDTREAAVAAGIETLRARLKKPESVKQLDAQLQKQQLAQPPKQAAGKTKAGKQPAAQQEDQPAIDAALADELGIDRNVIANALFVGKYSPDQLRALVANSANAGDAHLNLMVAGEAPLSKTAQGYADQKARKSRIDKIIAGTLDAKTGKRKTVNKSEGKTKQGEARDPVPESRRRQPAPDQYGIGARDIVDGLLNLSNVVNAERLRNDLRALRDSLDGNPPVKAGTDLYQQLVALERRVQDVSDGVLGQLADKRLTPQQVGYALIDTRAGGNGYGYAARKGDTYAIWRRWFDPASTTGWSRKLYGTSVPELFSLKDGATTTLGELGKRVHQAVNAGLGALIDPEVPVRVTQHGDYAQIELLADGSHPYAVMTNFNGNSQTYVLEKRNAEGRFEPIPDTPAYETEDEARAAARALHWKGKAPAPTTRVERLATQLRAYYKYGYLGARNPAEFAQKLRTKHGPVDATLLMQAMEQLVEEGVLETYRRKDGKLMFRPLRDEDDTPVERTPRPQHKAEFGQRAKAILDQLPATLETDPKTGRYPDVPKAKKEKLRAQVSEFSEQLRKLFNDMREANAPQADMAHLAWDNIDAVYYAAIGEEWANDETIAKHVRHYLQALIAANPPDGSKPDAKTRAPEHVHNEGKPYKPEPYEWAAGDAPVTFEGDVDDTVVLPLGLDEFKEATDDWARLFAAPTERVLLEHKAHRYGDMTLDEAHQTIEQWKAHAKAQAKVPHDKNGNARRVVLSLFDYTGEWSKPWVEAGYEVVPFDIQHGVDIMNFSAGYLADRYNFSDVYAIIAAVPCTDFTLAANRFWKDKDADGRTEASKELVLQTLRTIEYFRPTIWAIENPAGRIAKVAGLPEPSLTFDPAHFGVPYTKKTMIYGRFHADLPIANVFPALGSITDQVGGGTQDTKNARAETPEGFAYAFFMANNYLDLPVEVRLPEQFPEASGAIKAALKYGMSPDDVLELMERHYEHENGGRARSALIKAVAEQLGKEAADEARSNDNIDTGYGAADDADFDEDEDNDGGAAAGDEDDAEGEGDTLEQDGARIPDSGIGYWGTVDEPLKFYSGMSRPGDYKKLFAEHRNVGVMVGELSKKSVNQGIGEAMAESNGYLFVDSGAFPVYKINERAFKKALEKGFEDWTGEDVLEFEEIIARYQALEKAIGEADQSGEANNRVFFVMPDVVGRQEESLRLVGEFARDIKMWGDRAIVPLQVGKLSLTQAFESMMLELALDPDRADSPVIGIPSNKEAVSDEELIDLLEKHGDQIPGVHILGAVASAKLGERLDAIRAAGYKGNVSADANRLRALMYGERKRSDAWDLLMGESTPQDAFDKWLDLTPDDIVRMQDKDRALAKSWGYTDDDMPKGIGGNLPSTFPGTEAVITYDNKRHGKEQLRFTIEVAQGPNGKWAGGVLFHTGGNTGNADGMSRHPNFESEQYDSRMAAVQAMVADMKDKVPSALWVTIDNRVAEFQKREEEAAKRALDAKNAIKQKKGFASMLEEGARIAALAALDDAKAMKARTQREKTAKAKALEKAEKAFGKLPEGRLTEAGMRHVMAALLYAKKGTTYIGTDAFKRLTADEAIADWIKNKTSLDLDEAYDNYLKHQRAIQSEPFHTKAFFAQLLAVNDKSAGREGLKRIREALAKKAEQRAGIDAVWTLWREAAGDNGASGPRTVHGQIVPGPEFFIGINGKVMHVTGPMAAQEATDAQLKDIDDAIGKGQFQIYKRGTWSPYEDRRNDREVIYKATGTPPTAASAPAKASDLPAEPAPLQPGVLVRVRADQKQLVDDKYPGREGIVQRENSTAPGMWYVKLAATARAKEREELFDAKHLDVLTPASETAKLPPMTHAAFTEEMNSIGQVSFGDADYRLQLGEKAGWIVNVSYPDGTKKVIGDKAGQPLERHQVTRAAADDAIDWWLNRREAVKEPASAPEAPAAGNLPETAPQRIPLYGINTEYEAERWGLPRDFYQETSYNGHAFFAPADKYRTAAFTAAEEAMYAAHKRQDKEGTKRQQRVMDEEMKKMVAAARTPSTTPRFNQQDVTERIAAIEAAIAQALDADDVLRTQANPAINTAANFTLVFKEAFGRELVKLADAMPAETLVTMTNRLNKLPGYPQKKAREYIARAYPAADKPTDTPPVGGGHPMDRKRFIDELTSHGKVQFGEATFEVKPGPRGGIGRMQADTFVVYATYPYHNKVIGTGQNLSMQQVIARAAGEAFDWWNNDRVKEQQFEQKRQKLLRAGQRELYGVFAKDADLMKAATNEVAGNFAPVATTAVRAWVEQQMVTSANDAERMLMLNNIVVGGRVTLPKEWFDSLQKYLKRAARLAEKELNRDPAVYQAALVAAAQKVGLPPDEIALFKLGWDHALAGNTKSTLVPSQQMAQGYEAGVDWLKTEQGRDWFNGRRAKKLQGTGAQLRRWFDGARKRIDEVSADNLEDSWEIIKAQSSRADAFADVVPDNATPGTRRYVNAIRDQLVPFQEWLLDKGALNYLLGKMKWRATDSMKVAAFLTGDAYIPARKVPDGVEYAEQDATPAQRLAVLQQAARQYLDLLAPLADALRGATTIAEAAAAFDRVMIADKEKNSWYSRQDRLTEYGKKVEPLFRKGRYYPYEVGGHKVEDMLKVEQKPDSEVISKKQPLIVPKLDRVERDSPVDYRKGKNVTPEQMKETFGFADVGFGKWVAGRQDQDHLNYAFDAFMDLATFLGVDPKHMGLGGTLHFTVGALGHGKHAAHFQAKQPHPDGGEVPVINVTNTRGDGTIAHEWFHALDHALSTGWTTIQRGDVSIRVWVQHPQIQQLVKLLSKKYDIERVIKAIPSFLNGTSRMVQSGRKKPLYDIKTDKGLIENAEAGIDYYARTMRSTEYKRHADVMGVDYWGNPRELLARAAEAYVLDGMEGGNNYLVNPEWVEEGKIAPPQYRGAPYPIGEERKLFAEAMGALVKALRFTDAGVTIDKDAFDAAFPDQEKEFKESMAALKASLPERLQQVKNRARAKELEAERAAAEKATAEREAKAKAAPQYAAGDPVRYTPALGNDNEASVDGKVTRVWRDAHGEEHVELDTGHKVDVKQAGTRLRRLTDDEVRARAAEEARIKAELEKAAQQPGNAPQGDLSEVDYEALFDQAAAELAEEQQEQPDAPEPGEATAAATSKWTREDVEFLIQQIDDGKVILLADNTLGLKTIHDMPGNTRHMGFGTFQTSTSEFEAVWSGGGDMARTPSGQAYTTVNIGAGREAFLRFIEWDKAKAKLQSKLIVKQGPKAAPSLNEEQQRTAAQLAADAAKLGVKGIGQALEGLVQLFGGNKLKSFPAGFDKETYERAKPHFEAALASFQEAGKTLVDLLKFLIAKFGIGIRPYAVQFAKEKKLTTELAAKTSSTARMVEWVRTKLIEGSFTSKQLFEMADDAFGGTQAEGKYSVKDAYDAMEAGVNRYIIGSRIMPHGSATDAQHALDQLQAIVSHLPTQTRRTAEMDEFQQFSTPPHLAYMAAWVANIHSGETMLEPSAGIGGLAMYADIAGANVVVNELSSRRAAVLKEVLPNARHFGENAEQLHNVLPDDVQPTVIVMNPPFSSTAGRVAGQRDTANGAQHIEQALKRLQPGGRLVAIVGQGMAHDKPTFKDWWKKIAATYNVRANIGIDGSNYAKYGTTFDNQILVIDKTGPTTGTVLTNRVDSIDALPALLEGIRNDRQSPPESREPSESAPTEQGGDELPAGQGGQSAGAGGADADALGAGQRDHDQAAGTGGTGHGDGADAAGSDDDVGAAPGDGDAGAPGGKTRRGGAGGGRSGGRGKRGGRGGNAAGEPVSRDGASDAVTDNAGGIEVNAADAQRAEGELTDAIFENYTPQRLAIPGARPHPGKLVQSAAMAAVLPPAPTYTPNLPKAVITDGLLSIAQLESVVYAGQAHEQMLPSGERRGFFIGDGTGVGKGREISGIILDNLRAGRKKAVWVSAKQGLLKDAKRDFGGITGDADLIFPHSKTKADAKIDAKHGILFTTYDTLRSGAKTAVDAKTKDAKAKKAPPSRLDQLVKWLGEDFDGVIAFDESHKMGNAQEKQGSRGKQKASQVAMAGIELQRRLPKARVVYVSATGATEVSNLVYATRLGLWGEGAAFAKPQDFIAGIESGGVAAMELVSRDMKAMGAYIARSLSFDGVTYDRLDHELTPLQVDIYNELAKSWQIVLNNINEALDVSKAGKDGNAKSAALSRFWSTQLSFFSQIITSMQMPSIIEHARAELGKGNAVVMQLVNTNEASQERQAAKIAADDDKSFEDLDFTPRQTLMEYVASGFPIQQYEEYTDEEGNTRVRPVVDAEGKPVFNKDLIAQRDRLLKTLEEIRVPDNPVDMIINAFGHKAVAEVTGRSRRFVREANDDGQYKVVEQKRSTVIAAKEADDFQDDKRQVLVFSDAGGTGYSFQSDLTRKNQRRRIHYLVQPGWRANNAVQGFGRTHRSNEANQPHYVLPSTNIKAQKRFISSIARRLDQLGALTKGQRETGSQGMFNAADNLESQYSSDAIEIFFRDMFNNTSPLDFNDTVAALGLNGLRDPQTGALNISKLPKITQFLNRLLSLTLDQQDKVFGEFFKTLEEVIARAKAAGTYDTGVETIRALKVVKKRDEIVHTDARTGAETHFVDLELTKPTKRNEFADLDYYRLEWDKGVKKPDPKFVGFFRNNKTGEVFGMTKSGTSTDDKGVLHTRGMRLHPSGWPRYIDNVDEILAGADGKRQFKRKEMGKVYEGSTITEVYGVPGHGQLREYDTKLRELLAAYGEAWVDNHLDDPAFEANKPRQAALKKIWAQMKEKLVEREVERHINTYSRIDDADAEAAWNAELAATPATYTEPLRLLTGVLLPIWDRLLGHPQVVRTQTDDGERLLGRVVSNYYLKKTLKNLGVGSSVTKLSPAQVLERILAGERALLANGWEIKKVQVSHDTRIEVSGADLYDSDRKLLVQQGAFTERISWSERVFIPTGDNAVAVLERILGNKPLVDLFDKEGRSADDRTSGDTQADGTVMMSKAAPSELENPARRSLLLGAAAAALAPNAALADVPLGRAAPIDAAVWAQKVTPAAEKILRGNGATNMQGAKALREAMLEIAANGPQQVRGLAHQLARLLPEKGLLLTVDSRHLANAHGALEMEPLPHLTLFTAGGLTGLSYGTVLHETLHAVVAARYQSLSVGLIRNNDDVLKLNKPAAAQAMEQFYQVWREFKNAAYGDKFTDDKVELSVSEAIADPDEFFVRALTDARLQGYLASKEYRGATLWERFKNWVKSFLFVFKREGATPSWLDAALLASDELLDAFGSDAADYAWIRAIRKANAANGSKRDAHYERAEATAGAAWPLHTKVREALQRGDSLTSVLSLLADHTSDSYLAQLAGHLAKLKLPTGTRMEALKTTDGQAVAGEFDAQHDLVFIDPTHGSEVTIVHEAVHAATAWALSEGAKRNPAQALAVKEILAVYREVSLQPGAKAQYGLTNVHEFVAEAFTNGRFQQFLQAASQNWFARLLRAVRRIFGYDNGDYLERVMLAGRELIGSVAATGRPNEAIRQPNAITSLRAKPEAFARRMGDAIKDVTVTDVKASLGHRATDLRSLGLQALGRRQIMDIYGDLFAVTGGTDLLHQYNDLVMQMDADKNEAGANADGIADRWGKLADERALAELMHDATRYEVDPDKPLPPDVIPEIYNGLKKRFDALSDDAKAIYREARQTYRKHWMEVREAVRHRILRALPDHPRRAQLLKRMDAELFKPVKGVYFPLARFGEYMITVSDENGKAGEAVHFAETMAQAEAIRAQLMKAYPADKGYVVSKVTKRREFNAARDAVGRGFLKELFGVLDQEGVSEELQDAISQLYLTSLPDLSWAKHGIHRKGTPGFSQDARRAFAHNMFHGARYLAKLNYADQMAEKLDQMQEVVKERAERDGYDPVAGQQVVDEMVKRHDAYLNPNTNALSTLLTSAGFVFYLGASPAAAAVNLTQTPLVAFPVLGGKYGFGKASKALLTASKDAMRGHNDLSQVLTGDELKMYQQAIKSGVIDVSMAHDLAGIAQGEDKKLAGKLRPLMKGASFLFHHAERFNRQATILAAYRLARGKGLDHDAAYRAAVTDTYASHFDYSAGNRPRIMQGNVARVVLLFKQYAQNMIYTMARNFRLATKGDKEAARTLSALLGMHLMAAGILGLPVIGSVLGAMSLLGSDDDEPWDAEIALRNWLADVFGVKTGEVISHGLSRLTPWDLSGRVGLDQLLLPDVREGLQGQQAAEAWLAAAIGPVGSIGTNAVKGMALIAEGELTRGLEALLPTALRAPVRAVRYATEGAQDKTGIEILPEVSVAEVAGQMLGLAPSRVREATDGKAAIHDAARALSERRAELLSDFARAQMDGDGEQVAQVMAAIGAFNEKHPRMAIMPLHLQQSLRQRVKRRALAEQGVYLPTTQAEAREAGRFALDDE